MDIKKTEKKKWTRPQLIVLGRGAPEEAVLSVCKRAQDLGPFATCDQSPVCSQTPQS